MSIRYRGDAYTTPLEKEAIANNASLKKKLKTTYFAHNDICAYDDLQADETGTNARVYDRRISASLPLILKSV